MYSDWLQTKIVMVRINRLVSFYKIIVGFFQTWRLSYIKSYNWHLKFLEWTNFETKKMQKQASHYYKSTRNKTVYKTDIRLICQTGWKTSHRV